MPAATPISALIDAERFDMESKGFVFFTDNDEDLEASEGLFLAQEAHPLRLLEPINKGKLRKTIRPSFEAQITRPRLRYNTFIECAGGGEESIRGEGLHPRIKAYHPSL